MSHHLIGSLLLLVCGIAVAQVKPGENILINGNLEAEQTPFPILWNKSSAEGITYNSHGGPENSGAIIFDNPKATPMRLFVRQQGLQLAAGETYKLSCWAKTKDFHSQHNGVIVHNNGWHSEQGVRLFPVNTNGWTFFEKEFTLEPSSDGKYGIAIFGNKFTGHLEIAKVSMEAISTGALANTQKSTILEDSQRPRLVPWHPLLCKIPADKPQMEFKCFCAKRIPGLKAIFSIDNRASVSLPATDIVTLPMQGLTLGPHTIAASLTDANGQEVFSRTFHAEIIANPQINTASHVRLNNFVTSIIDKTLMTGTQTVSFDAPRDGWLFIAVQQPAVDEKFSVCLDNGLTIIHDKTKRQETFRLVSRGPHTLTISGAITGARLIVRSIIEIFNYPLCCSSQVPQNGKYDWDFHEKYVFPAVTTLNGGNAPADKRPELRRRGLLWLANLGTTQLKNKDDLVQRLNKASGIISPVYDGVTCDEQFFHEPSLTDYAEALWDYPTPDNKLIYTWIVGKPVIYGLHSDFISSAVNVSRSRGRLIYEAYCHTLPTEAQAAEYLNNRLKDTMLSFMDYYQDAKYSTGILLGNFNQIPIISLDVNPEVDYKYYLDMQLNMLANDPLFDGLATTGYWGSYYDDEELYRWSFRLLRHYCVEGNTELLSKDPKFQYAYRPELLKNCDFLNQGDTWTLAPAAEKSIEFTAVSGFGTKQERRWGCSAGTGDSMCVFTRQPNRPNSLSQTMRNLVPGRIYTLQFCSADYTDLTKGIHNPKAISLKAVFGNGVTPLPEQSYVFIDRSPDTDKHKGKGARINLHHLRFRATDTSALVTFTDEDAAPGARIAFNYIMLKPYYEN